MNHGAFYCLVVFIVALLVECGLSAEPGASSGNQPPAASESAKKPEFDRYIALCQPLARALAKLDEIAKPDTDLATYRQQVKSAYEESVKLNQTVTKEQQQWAYHVVLCKALSAFRRAGDAVKSDHELGLREEGFRGLAEDVWLAARSLLRLAELARETEMEVADAMMLMKPLEQFTVDLEGIGDQTDIALPQIRQLEEHAKEDRASANQHRNMINLMLKKALIEIHSDDPEERRGAVNTLGAAALASDLGEMGSQILDALKKASEDPDRAVRTRAVEALKGFHLPKPAGPESAIFAVQEWGGTVQFDERRLETPVIGVAFKDSNVLNSVMDEVTKFSELRRLSFFNTPHIGDPALARLDRFPRLTMLGLYRTRITDEGLKYVGKLHGLESLDVSHSRITDSGVAHLKGLRGLKTLRLNHTLITDSGLEHLEGMLDLKTLELSGASLTDKGMVHLRGFVKLKSLNLDATRANERAPQLGELLRLLTREANGETLSLSEKQRLESLQRQEERYKTLPRVGDDGLAFLSGLVDLEELILGGTAVTDRSIALVKQFRKLRYINMSDTSVSDKAIQELKNALPELHVTR